MCKAYEETINKYLTSDRWIEEDIFFAHFPVVRTDRGTTKTRIVFDVLANKDGISVNGLIHAGPKLQNNLFDALIQFGRSPVVVVCYISDMYLQTKLRPDNCKYFRFSWQHMDRLKEPSCYEF